MPGTAPKEFVPCIFCPWPLFSKQDLEERSPSRLYRDEKGNPKPMPQGKEQNFMKTTCELIRDAGQPAGTLPCLRSTLLTFLSKPGKVKCVVSVFCITCLLCKYERGACGLHVPRQRFC